MKESQGNDKKTHMKQTFLAHYHTASIQGESVAKKAVID
jgi:hypothetical protein